jgi:hypothetical protein
MLKILILATPRSGSTSLSRVIGSIFNLEVFYEPFVNGYVGKKYDNKGPHIVKTLIWDISIKDFNFNNYTHIIYLTRKNIKQAAESFCYHLTHNLNRPHKWHSSYYISEPLDIEKEYKLIEEGYNTLHSLSNNITYYEDIFSGDKKIVNKSLERIGLDIDYELIKDKINPIKKYRLNERKLI